VGRTQRVAGSGQKLWGAAGPRFFNANENLDIIMVLDKTTSIEEINKLGGTLASESNTETLSILVTVPANYDVSNLGGEHQRSDRFGYFPKEDLVNLLYSIEYSIAVTEKKLAVA
jgi:hypothetical protein